MTDKEKRYLNCKYLDAGMDGMLCSMNLCTTCKEFNGEKCSYYTPKNKMKDKEIKLPKAKCVKCKHAIIIDGVNVYCPKLIALCGKDCGVGGFLGSPTRCKFYEVNNNER